MFIKQRSQHTITMRIPCLIAPILVLPCVLAGKLPPGSFCSSSQNHIDSLTKKFFSDCNDNDYCTGANGTCVPRTCRRDLYAFGYNATEIPPPLCGPGTFCPDEGSGCQPRRPVGGSCELARDEQCAPPPDMGLILSDLSVVESICLNSVCQYKNATLYQPCILENTSYSVIDTTGQQSSINILRDNCLAPGLYCDLQARVCAEKKSLQSGCTTDLECDLNFCDSNGRCALPPGMTIAVAGWQYGLTSVFIIAAMAALVTMLTILHRRQRLEHYKKIREYYCEQLSLRQSIITFYSAVTHGASSHTNHTASRSR